MRASEREAKKKTEMRRLRKQALLQVMEYDPVLWYLHKGCSEEIRDAWKTNARFTLLEGPQRSSKTTAGMALAAAYLRGIHPMRPWFGAVRGAIVIPSRPQSATEWGPRLVGGFQGLYPPETAGCRLYKPGDMEMARRPWIPEDELERVSKVQCTAGWSLSAIFMANGSVCYIVLGDDPNSWKPIESTSLDFVVRDEAVGDTTLGASLTMRLGDAIQMDLDGARRGAGWQIWTATEFLPNKELSEERRRCEDPEKTDHRRFVLTPQGNPACTDEARKVLSGAVSEREAAKRITGQRNASQDYRVYGEQYSRERHLLKHTVKFDPTDNIILSLDPGVKNPFGIAVFIIKAEKPDQLIGVAYFSATGTHGKELLMEVSGWLQGRPITYVIYDPAANQTSKVTNKPLADSIIEWFDELGIVVLGDFLPGNNRHETTIQQVRECLDPSPWDKTVEPKVVFDPFGPGMDIAIDELEAYRFDKNGAVHKKEDTFPDCLRYLITQSPVYEPVMSGYQKRAKTPIRRMAEGDSSGIEGQQREYFSKVLAWSSDEDDAEVEDLYGGVL